jgi:signal transduction histidine kinase
MLCILGVAAAASAYAELGMMSSATAAEYGEWLRWDHLHAFLGVIGQVGFVHYYLGTARVSLMWTIIAMRSIVLVLNFLVHPNFNFSSIVSLRQVTLFGEQISAIGVAVTRTEWQWLATASMILMVAYLIDAVVQQWRKGDEDSRRKALAVSLGILFPLFFNAILNQLVVFGVLQAPMTLIPWFLGSLLTMAYELGREFSLSRRQQLALAEARAQLAQTQRVHILGQLASALAHELSQPLAATASNVGAALIELDSAKPDIQEVRSILGDIGKDDRRAVEIVARMRQLSQRRAIETQPLRVEDLVQDVVSLVHSEANSKQVAVSLLMQPGLPPVLGDRVHLSQVLLNLLMNSIDAVQSRPPDARRIVVEARTVDAKGEVEMAVQDSGPGIPDSIAEDVFKPFFTTKPEGMGVGLALSRTIIEAHGGRLWTDRMTQQDGAIFRFTLRRVPSPEASTETKIVPQIRSERAASAQAIEADEASPQANPELSA